MLNQVLPDAQSAAMRSMASVSCPLQGADDQPAVDQRPPAPAQQLNPHPSMERVLCSEEDEEEIYPEPDWRTRSAQEESRPTSSSSHRTGSRRDQANVPLQLRDWWEPSDIQELMERQHCFVRPHVGSLWRTLAITVLPALYFLGRVLPQSQSQASRAGPSAVFCTAWGITGLLALALAAFRNPGVVPRSKDKRLSVPARFVRVNGVELKQSWCNTCRVFRPLRSKHCAYCDRCVFQFDHHCTWLGNCVGLGNYRSFLLLVLAAAVFFGHSAVITCKVLWRLFFQADPKVALRKFLIANGGELLYVTYAIGMFLAFGILLLYHSIIIACNLTTNEHVRDYYLHLERNPFDKTCMENYHQVLCSPYDRNGNGAIV